MSSFVASWPATVRRGGNRLAAWLRAWLSAYVPWLVERRPTVQIDLGPWLPGWALRLAMGMLALGCAGPFVRNPLVSTVIIGLAIAVTLRPSGVGPSTVLIVIAVLAAAGPAPSAGDTLRTGLLVLGLHALAQLGQLVGRSSWTARVELSTLLVPLPRFLAIQAVVQPLALLGGWLSGRALGPAAWAILAILGLVVVTYVWLPRLDETS